MTKALSSLLLSLMLVLALAACGNGDDDDPTATTASTDATATTAPTEPAATSTTAPDTSASPETGDFTDEEAALLDLLLSAGDLPGSWNQLRVEAPELSTTPGICDAPPFPRANERIAEVEVEYQSTDGARFVLQDLTQFPEDVAVEAMEYIRATATCSEWTDESGTVFEISPADVPAIGDESHAIHVAFQVADAGRLEGDFVFVRLDGYVAIVTTLELGNYDPAFSAQIAQLAAGKIGTLAGTGSNVTDEEAALIDGLLSIDDFGPDWDQPQPPRRSDPAFWTGLCDAELFPGTDDAIARVATDFYEGFASTSASLQQLLISYPTGQAEAAFDYEQEAATCESFTRSDAEITVEPAPEFPALGDESFAVRFSFTATEQEAGGYWIVIRRADLLTTLIYTDPDALDIAEAAAIATAAADRMDAAIR
jgi:hypothetical protein